MGTPLDPQLFEEIMADVAAGIPTWRALDSRGVVCGTFYAYKARSPELGESYARAKAEGVEGVVDDAMRIADDPDIKADDKRVRVDLRKWYASKLASKVYGEHLHLEHSGNIGNEIMERLARGRKRVKDAT
jgi:hypothetical protein